MLLSSPLFHFFFFNDTATTEIYTLSLHDALPIYRRRGAEPQRRGARGDPAADEPRDHAGETPDRKSTRLNSSHLVISYAVFCLKKKKKKKMIRYMIATRLSEYKAEHLMFSVNAVN